MNPPPKVGIISQARMTSTRLPGKILKLVQQHPLLYFHLKRLEQSKLPIYVATTTNESDNPIAEFCMQSNIKFSRGDEQNVLSRFYECAQKFSLDVIVRVTSDCPLIDGELIGEAVNEYLKLGDVNCYYSNCLERTYPRGFDFEVFSFEMLKSASQFATTVAQKEHVTPFFYQNAENKFHLKHFKNIKNSSSYRITVDTPEDFELVKKLIEEHHCATKNASQIISVLESNSELVSINQHIEQKKT